MIEKKLISKLEKYSIEGIEYLLDEEEKKNHKFNFSKRLRDFDSEHVLQVIRDKKPIDTANLFYALMKSTSDLNVHAHIYGYESMREMNEAIDKEKENIHYSKEFEEKLKELDRKIADIRKQGKD